MPVTPRPASRRDRGAILGRPGVELGARAPAHLGTISSLTSGWRSRERAAGAARGGLRARRGAPVGQRSPAAGEAPAATDSPDAQRSVESRTRSTTEAICEEINVRPSRPLRRSASTVAASHPGALRSTLAPPRRSGAGRDGAAPSRGRRSPTGSGPAGCGRAAGSPRRRARRTRSCPRPARGPGRMTPVCCRAPGRSSPPCPTRSTLGLPSLHRSHILTDPTRTTCRLPAERKRRRYRRPAHVQPVHLHDAPPVPGAPARQGGAQGHLAVLPPRRQDRRARPQRRRQDHAAADHGRRGHRVPRRGPARARRHRRAARAGAAARPGQGRPRQRRGGRRRARARCWTASTSSPPNYSDETADELARLQEQHRRRRRLGPRPTLEIAMDALRLPAGRRRRRPRSPAASAAASPSAGCCCASPTCCCSTSPPTTSTPSRSPGWSATCTSTRAPSSPSPTIATSSTTSPAGSSSSTAAAASPGRATTPPGWSRSRPAWQRRRSRRPARQRTLPRELEWVRMSPPRPARPRARPACTATRSCWPRSATTSSRTSRSTSRRARTSATWSSRPRTSRKGYGDHLLIEDLTFRLPPGGIVGVIGPNGAGKTTLFRMITGQEKPDAGDAAHRRHRRARPTSIRTATRSTPTRPSARRSPAGTDHIDAGQAARSTPAPTSPASTSRGPTSRRRSASSRAASATASTWPSCCAAAATCCCSTSRPTTSTSTRCARWRRRCSNFAGCAVVISHDRWFLDRIATHILAFEGDSQVRLVRGQLPGLRGPAARAPRRRGRPAAPHQLQEAGAGRDRFRGRRGGRGTGHLTKRRPEAWASVRPRAAGRRPPRARRRPSRRGALQALRRPARAGGARHLRGRPAPAPVGRSTPRWCSRSSPSPPAWRRAAPSPRGWRPRSWPASPPRWGSPCAPGGRARPAACFGARSRVTRWGAGRALALTGAFAAVPFLPEGHMSADAWLATGLAGALLAVAGLGVTVAALAREVGMLRLALGPQAALEVPEEGPELGGRTSLGAKLRGARPRAARPGRVHLGGLLALPACCAPPSSSCARTPTSRWPPSTRSPTPRCGGRSTCPGAPSRWRWTARASTLAKGTFNSLAQLEGLLAVAERRAARCLTG